MPLQTMNKEQLCRKRLIGNGAKMQKGKHRKNILRGKQNTGTKRLKAPRHPSGSQGDFLIRGHVT